MDELQWRPKVQPGTDPGTEISRDRGNTKAPQGFQEVLEGVLEEVNALQNQADDAIREIAQGRTQDLHRTMVLIEKAQLSFKLMMQVRNKLLEAYQEIMRTQV